MDEKNIFENSNVIRKKSEELKENNLIKEKENNEFKINKEEIQLYSPEELQDLLVKEQPNNNIKNQEEKINKKNMIKRKNLEIKMDNIERKNKNEKILNFDELLEIKRKKEKVNKTKIKNKINKIKPKIDFSGRLYQPKRNYNITENSNKNENNYGRTKERNNISIIKNKSSKSYEPSEKRKKISNKKIINEFLMRNYKIKNKEKTNKIEDYDLKIINNNKKKINLRSQKNNSKINYDKLRYLKTTQSYENKINRNKSPTKSKNKEIKKIKKKLKIINIPIPNNIIETEINLALKNKIINIPKHHSPKNNSKYDKINNEEMRYNLMKEYSNIKPEKEKGFLRRMQFYSLKKNKRQENINKLIEKNKYKLNESERNITFNRLITDANRRITKRNNLENEKMNRELINQNNNNKNNNKKYNEEEWNKIYNQRFRAYSEYKKKKLEIKKEKEKIEKMIGELQLNLDYENINSNIINNSKLNENIKIQEIKKKYKSNINEQNDICEFYNKSENNINNYSFNDIKNKHQVNGIINYENFKKMKKGKLNVNYALIKKIPIDNKNRRKKYGKIKNINYIKLIRNNNSQKNNLIMKNSYSTNYINKFNKSRNKQNNGNNIIHYDSFNNGKIHNEGNIVDKYLFNYCLKYNYIL